MLHPKVVADQQGTPDARTCLTHVATACAARRMPSAAAAYWLISCRIACSKDLTLLLSCGSKDLTLLLSWGIVGCAGTTLRVECRSGTNLLLARGAIVLIVRTRWKACQWTDLLCVRLFSRCMCVGDQMCHGCVGKLQGWLWHCWQVGGTVVNRAGDCTRQGTKSAPECTCRQLLAYCSVCMGV